MGPQGTLPCPGCVPPCPCGGTGPTPSELLIHTVTVLAETAWHNYFPRQEENSKFFELVGLPITKCSHHLHGYQGPEGHRWFTSRERGVGSVAQGWGWLRVSRCPTPVPELPLPVGWREPQAARDSGRHILTCPAERRPLSSPTPAQETTCPQQL